MYKLVIPIIAIGKHKIINYLKIKNNSICCQLK